MINDRPLDGFRWVAYRWKLLGTGCHIQHNERYTATVGLIWVKVVWEN
jgi:hypothetical protein